MQFAFGANADSEGPDQTAHAQSDQGLHCPLSEPGCYSISKFTKVLIRLS